MRIYKQEKEDGLFDKLSEKGKLMIASLVTPSEDKICEKIKSHILNRGQEKACASITDIDLYPLNSILVSTNWNLNDAVFDPIETFSARKTPEDKPINYEHNESDIIGHIIACKAIDRDGKEISSDTPIDELPELFDIHTSGVLYKIWKDETLQDRMNNLIGEIVEKKWYVSMECWFKNFDYAFLEKDGTQKVIARNSKTSFLTKYLKFYGGDGVYNDNRIGMVPRNFIFAGKGLTKNPANPSSVIYDFSSLTAKYYTSTLDAGYQLLSRDSNYQGESMEKELAEAKNALATATEAQKAAEAKVAEVEKALADAVTAKDSATVKVTELTDEIAKVNEKVINLEKSKAESDKLVEDTKKELAKIHTELVTVKRTHLVLEKGLSKEEASKYVSNSLSQNDEQFVASIEFINKVEKKQLPEVETNKPKVELPKESATATVTPPPTVEKVSASKTLASSILKHAGKGGSQE